MRTGAKARPVAQYLARFSDAAEEKIETAADDESAPKFQAAPSCAEDPAALAQAAREEGYAEGLALGAANCSAQLADHARASEGALASARAAWVSAEGEALAKKIAQSRAEIEAAVAASLARVLRPFLAEGLRALAIDRLVQDIGLLLDGSEGPVVRISGPADLLGALRRKLPNGGAGVDYAPGESVDVEVIAGRTFIDSRLEAWMKRINAVPE